jgi:glutaredoxin-related protein
MGVKELIGSGVQSHFMKGGTDVPTCGYIVKEIYLVHVEM